jgi:hypothetical protein
MQKQRLRQKDEKKSRSIDIIHVLTIRKRQKEFSHLWTSMKFDTSTDKKKIVALIDCDFNQNFIDQRFAYKWRLSVDAKSSTNLKTINETSLRVFRSYSLNFISVEDDEKVARINQALISAHIIEIHVILEMSWLRKINSHVNWKTSKWRLRDDLESSSTDFSVKNDKQESKNRLINAKRFYIA